MPKKQWNKIMNHAKKVSETTIKKGKEKIIEPLNGNIHLEDLIDKAFKIPGIKVDRENFLRKELEVHYESDFVNQAIEQTPMMAGIPSEDINKIADAVIEYERRHVSGVSAGLGIPGGVTAVATLPADLIQNFAFLLRCAQKLMYLYGLPQIEFEENKAASMHIIVLSLGVMYGMKDASIGLKALASMVQSGIDQQMIYKALIKGKLFPIVKEIETWFEKRMIKEVFGNFFEKAVPVIGAVVGGGITYLSFKKYCSRLKNVLKDTKQSNIKYYESKEEREQIDLIINEILEKEFLLNLKAERYEDLNIEYFKDLPDPKVAYQIQSDGCNGMLVSFIVSEVEAMDYESNEKNIEGFHEEMDQNDALIECGVGKTNKENPYAYRISKLKMDETKISYNLGLNIQVNETNYYVDGSFVEEGMTGMRDNVGLHVFKKKLKKENSEQDYSIEDVLKLYYRDPYDPTIQRDFLMNASEAKEYDSMFPKHPLSELRAYLKWVIEEN